VFAVKVPHVGFVRLQEGQTQQRGLFAHVSHWSSSTFFDAFVHTLARLSPEKQHTHTTALTSLLARALMHVQCGCMASLLALLGFR